MDTVFRCVEVIRRLVDLRLGEMNGHSDGPATRRVDEPAGDAMLITNHCHAIHRPWSLVRPARLGEYAVGRWVA